MKDILKQLDLYTKVIQDLVNDKTQTTARVNFDISIAYVNVRVHLFDKDGIGVGSFIVKHNFNDDVKEIKIENNVNPNELQAVRSRDRMIKYITEDMIGVNVGGREDE